MAIGYEACQGLFAAHYELLAWNLAGGSLKNRSGSGLVAYRYGLKSPPNMPFHFFFEATGLLISGTSSAGLLVPFEYLLRFSPSIFTVGLCSGVAGIAGVGFLLLGIIFVCPYR